MSNSSPRVTRHRPPQRLYEARDSTQRAHLPTQCIPRTGITELRGMKQSVTAWAPLSLPLGCSRPARSPREAAIARRLDILRAVRIRDGCDGDVAAPVGEFSAWEKV